jgi:hypothetical protein
MKLRLLGVCLLLAGCGSFLEPPEPLPPAELPVRFEAAATGMGTESAVEGRVGEVVVRDIAVTGVCHRHEHQGAYLRRDTLAFWIAHTGYKRGACPDIGRLLPYQASIDGIPRGEYRVRIEYLGDVSSHSQSWPDDGVRITVW